MLKSATSDKHFQQDEFHEDQKVDRYIKSCRLNSVISDFAKIKNTERDHCTWIGHSTCLIQTNGIYVLTDPVWSDLISPIPLIGPRRITQSSIQVQEVDISNFNNCNFIINFIISHIQIEDLPCDIVVLSHTHYDHLDLPTAKRIGNRAIWFVNINIISFLPYHFLYCYLLYICSGWFH